jgi:fused signal recognition particle receptor
LILDQIGEEATPLQLSDPLNVILIVGVNGVGKTTTIGKLANRLRLEGKKVVIAAADTFRAAAIEQLRIWSERSECQIVEGADGADPASVVYNAIEKAKSVGAEVVIVDTAGRLHNKANRMKELERSDASWPRWRAPQILFLTPPPTERVVASESLRAMVPLTGIVLTVMGRPKAVSRFPLRPADILLSSSVGRTDEDLEP